MDTSGKRYRYRQIIFWAERGLINIIDERLPPSHPHAFVIQTRRTWLEKLDNINAKLDLWDKWPDEREELANYIDNGIACAKEAKKQGDPIDPVAAAEILRSRRKSIIVGNGQQAVLHTASASSVPEGLLLPAMPGAPADRTERKKLIIP